VREQRYVIAKKSDGTPDDLQKRLAAFQGVSVEGAYGGRVLIRATPEAILKIRAEFAADYYIEPLLPRRPNQAPSWP
jgi:hypothetical protein